MVMTHFYQQNVFESCLKIFARLRAKILQIRVKTGHFGVKMGITISSSYGLVLDLTHYHVSKKREKKGRKAVRRGRAAQSAEQSS